MARRLRNWGSPRNFELGSVVLYARSSLQICEDIRQHPGNGMSRSAREFSSQTNRLGAIAIHCSRDHSSWPYCAALTALLGSGFNFKRCLHDHA
jgi:hypothetical protein